MEVAQTASCELYNSSLVENDFAYSMLSDGVIPQTLYDGKVRPHSYVDVKGKLFPKLPSRVGMYNFDTKVERNARNHTRYVLIHLIATNTISAH